MAKSCAQRMTLEAIVQMRRAGKAPGAMVLEKVAHIKALLRTYAVFDPADDCSAESQLKKMMATTQIVAVRTRPHPFNWGLKWESIITALGLKYAEVIADKIKDHNKNPDEALKFTYDEKTVMIMYPHFSATAKAIMDYHWSQFKPEESGLPIEMFARPDLNPYTQPKRGDSSNQLWVAIRSYKPEQTELRILREILTVVKNIKEWQRMRTEVLPGTHVQ